MAVWIALFICLSCVYIDAAQGGVNPLQAMQAANTLNQANQMTGGQAGGVIEAMPKCNCPTDTSCDNVPMDQLGQDVMGGALLQGAGAGMGPSLAGMGRRRRRFADVLSGMQGMQAVQGASLVNDPNMLGMISKKCGMCKENEDMQSQMGPQLNQLQQGNFNGISDSFQSQTQNIGATCNKMLKTEDDKCKILKRQICGMKSGKLADPSQLQCAFKDIIKQAGQIKAKDESCKTADKLIKNPKDAPNILQSGGTGVATGIGAGMVADKTMG